MSNAQPSTPVILLVDDEPDTLRANASRLAETYADRHGVAPVVLTAGSADAAFAKLAEQRARHQPVHVLVTDLDMPGRSGLSLAVQVAARVAVLAITDKPLTGFRDAADALRVQPEVWAKPSGQDEWDAFADRVYEIYRASLVAASLAALVETPSSPLGPATGGTRPGAVLAVRVDLGPVDDLAEVNRGQLAVERLRGRANAFEAAVRANGGKPAVVFGQLLTAVFFDSEGVSGLESGGRALRAYVASAQKALPTLVPEVAAAIVPGFVQYGLIGEPGSERSAVLGAVAEAAVQLLVHVRRGGFGYAVEWVTADQRVLLRGLPFGPEEVGGPVPILGFGNPVRIAERRIA